MKDFGGGGWLGLAQVLRVSMIGSWWLSTKKTRREMCQCVILVSHHVTPCATLELYQQEGYQLLQSWPPEAQTESTPFFSTYPACDTVTTATKNMSRTSLAVFICHVAKRSWEMGQEGLVEESHSTPQLPALLTYILALGMKSPSDFVQPECCIKQYISVCQSVALSNTLVSNCGTW